MSHPISSYSFPPWLRQGIANRITAADPDTDVKLRAPVSIEVELTGQKIEGGSLPPESIPKDIPFGGPGDIIGIYSKAIIKTEPHHGITNFEPNYLPYIEFYDEDFAWRYTPAAPNKGLHRLRPWIMLVVLKEDEEFKEGGNILNRPLPYIEVENAANLFPPAEQLWAWAHVQVNQDLGADENEIISTDMAAVLPRLRGALTNPDMAYCRILCPRKLEENTGYHAFLIPVFESGRLAGLGFNPAETKFPHATYSAWADYQNRQDSSYFPYYYRWHFRTGMLGDFEYLVRLLKPKPVDTRVGRRDMDVQDPGSNLRGITDSELGGVLKLGGALQLPTDTLKEEDKAEVLKYDNWDQPHPQEFQKDLAKFINLADEYAVKPAEQAHRDSNLNKAIQDDPDPLITPPLYGRWHALVQRLLKDRQGADLYPNDNWVHMLNLDPRHRVAAGFGTQIIQKNQEEYMDAAWEQIGPILSVNQGIREAQLVLAMAGACFDHHLVPLQKVNAEKVMVLTAPVQKRVVTQGFTVSHQVKTSVVPDTVFTTTARMVLRPGGRLMKSMEFTESIRPTNLIARLNNLKVFSARPKTAPKGMATLKHVADSLLPQNVPKALVNLLRQHPWSQYSPLLLILAIVLLLVFFNPGGFWIALSALASGGMLYLYRRLGSLVRQIKQADSILEENQTPEAVDRLPKSPDFVVTEPGAEFTPPQGAADSVQASRYKEALKLAYRMVDASKKATAQPVRQTLDLNGLTSAVVRAIDPRVTIPRYTFLKIKLPPHLIDLIGEEFKEVMAYPKIDLPMYKPLADMSAELFLPNINYVEQNSISLLETNQKFIEAYMVGLNHEFARELLWREYPTDQRGSYFRQFWDVSSYLDTKTTDPDALREKLKDIPPLHLWSRYSKLGDHDQREASGDKEEEVVLVIRGELLKKYPTAVIYAHRARWQYTDGKIDKTRIRLLVDIPESEEDNPPPDKIKTPLYEAKVEPDIYFFGFDLTAKAARGGTGVPPDDDPGWFFVIKERPGEPRFGLDIGQGGQLNTWNDLSWNDVTLTGGPGSYLQFTDATPTITLIEPTGPEVSEKELTQYQDDKSVTWDKDTNAANLAYILYQVPMLVAVHAAEMLESF
jgi:hypothetical protein